MDTTTTGRIVQTRWRFDDYLDEPHDIIYTNQDYGYINSKTRPVLIIDIKGTDVIAVPFKTKLHPDGKLKYGAKKAIESGNAFEITDNIETHMPNHSNGTILDLSEIRRIPIKEFSFRELRDPKTDQPSELPDSVMNKIHKQLNMTRSTMNSKINSIPINQNNRIHNDDLQVRFEAVAKTMKNKRSNLTKNAKAELLKLKNEKRVCFSKSDSERAEHMESRKLGLTREEMTHQILISGLDDLNAQDDLQPC